MSPVPGPGRKVAALVGCVLTLALFATFAAAQAAEDYSIPADAPAPSETGIIRVFTFTSVETGACADGSPAPCWDVTRFAADPGDTVVLVADLVKRDGFHNLHATDVAGEVTKDTAGPKTAQGPNLFHKVAITMPAEGQITFICDVHPDTMVGHVSTPAAFAASGGGHASVPAMGVHFLAYWVGVIAFAILFVVYGITFFLFKYNETSATTDHFDRSGDHAPESKRLATVAPLLAVGLAVVAIAAVVYLASR